ncbi:MAG TPA: hypothetical protein PLU05_01980 [Candidatus Cloacimonas acidaminovorans]|jgi:hypothetical protein|nr:hypothetical protein [Candidatus Cloacimonas acidaminovorans]HRS60171.1 hypothetical protein [Candidatus Cloacimonas sp.]HOE54851.1 hypothetical protein [Candidatus Cloacimonas acidaminovorans]HOM78739.1 hypothetical protein [Candidatus Cloacimonas acidaminovorans]HOS07104.1 hypothetical protein [Candidatus Cloacimonas acidaminovorans]
MKNKRTELNLKEEKVLLTFIQQTKEGKYVKIDESSFPYSRIKEQSEDTYFEDEYYYSIR